MLILSPEACSGQEMKKNFAVFTSENRVQC
jgi:hypothetical protein